MKKIIKEICLKILWALMDDASMCYSEMRDEYMYVPKDLLHKTMRVYKFWDEFEYKDCLDWINKDE